MAILSNEDISKQPAIQLRSRMLSEPFRLSYYHCLLPTHTDEPLNTLCIDSSCPHRGLVCSLCRETHLKHMIVPLKNIFVSLAPGLEHPTESSLFQKELEQIERCKSVQLLALRECVERMAEEFRAIEQTILEKYQQMKIELLERVQSRMRSEELLRKVIQDRNQDVSRTEYEEGFKGIASIIKDSSGKIEIIDQLAGIVQEYKQVQNTLLQKLQEVTDATRKLFRKENLFSEPLAPPSRQEIPLLFRGPYKFSLSAKAPSIELGLAGLNARQSHTGPSRFVLIEEGIGIQRRKIVFKLTRLTNWVGLGVALRPKISSIGFAFKHEIPLHGSYLLSNNGFTWSHSEVSNNSHLCGVGFKEGQHVEVTLSEHQIIFHVREDNKTMKLDLHFKPEEWHQVCFCANLCSEGDSVEIVNV